MNSSTEFPHGTIYSHPTVFFFLVLIAYRKHPMYTCKLVLEHIAWTQDALLGPWSTCVADARGQYGRKKKRDDGDCFLSHPHYLSSKRLLRKSVVNLRSSHGTNLMLMSKISCSRSLTLGSFEVRRLTWP